MKNKIKKINLKRMLSNIDISKYNEKILNGQLLSQVIQHSITEKLKNFKNKLNENNIYLYEDIIPPPKLKVILVGDRMDSKVYVENKLKMCDMIGMEGELKVFPNSAEKEEILEEEDKDFGQEGANTPDDDLNQPGSNVDKLVWIDLIVIKRHVFVRVDSTF